MTRLGEAIALASDVHRYQVDKAGAPYILHSLEVMRRATDYYQANSDGWKIEDVQITAVLHDALEDIEGERTWEKARLSARIYDAFGHDVSRAVDAITKRTLYSNECPQGHREPYDEYLVRVSEDWIARIVKIADLSHNLDAFRIPSTKITERDFKRWDKYHRALILLTRTETVVNA